MEENRLENLGNDIERRCRPRRLVIDDFLDGVLGGVAVLCWVAQKSVYDGKREVRLLSLLLLSV